MKKALSIKTRITIWYTSLLCILILVVLALVGGFSYRLSNDRIEKNVVLRVTNVLETISRRHHDSFEFVENKEEFKKVSIYTSDGEYIAGQYIYDAGKIPFHEGGPRHENIGGKECIVYDKRTPSPPGTNEGLWVRGLESVSSSMLLGKIAMLIVLVLVPLILLFAIWGGYHITMNAFRPVNSIIKTANDISTQNDLTRRIDIPVGAKDDELNLLSVTLNHMLDRIEHLMDQEKQFTSDASHELRTPISVILAQGEYLLDIAKDEKERELAASIVDKANQVSKLVSHLLLLARIDQSRQKCSLEKVDLGLLLDIAADSMKELAAAKDITLSAEAPDNTFVMADEALLLSAVTNLINNGIKYGKPSGYVAVSAVQKDGKTEITVKDNGIGIAKEHLDKIWDRFYRVDDVRNDEYASYGLGLPMVKSIVTLHGGTVSVKSTPGEGTEFKIILK